MHLTTLTSCFCLLIGCLSIKCSDSFRDGHRLGLLSRNIDKDSMYPDFDAVQGGLSRNRDDGELLTDMLLSQPGSERAVGKRAREDPVAEQRRWDFFNLPGETLRHLPYNSQDVAVGGVIVGPEKRSLGNREFFDRFLAFPSAQGPRQTTTFAPELLSTRDGVNTYQFSLRAGTEVAFSYNLSLTLQMRTAYFQMMVGTSVERSVTTQTDSMRRSCEDMEYVNDSQTIPRRVTVSLKLKCLTNAINVAVDLDQKVTVEIQFNCGVGVPCTDQDMIIQNGPFLEAVISE